jgi:hypothetical protein
MKHIAGALVKAQSEMAVATKDSKNPFFRSNYADLNAIREAVLPALNKNGIVVLQPTVVTDSGKSFVRTTLLHESGESITSDTEIVCAKANDPQAFGSAMSYARRYSLQSLMCVGAEDNDGESAMGRSTTAMLVAKGAAVMPTATTAAPTAAAPAAKEEAPKAKPSFRNKSKATETSGDLI